MSEHTDKVHRQDKEPTLGERCHAQAMDRLIATIQATRTINEATEGLRKVLDLHRPTQVAGVVEGVIAPIEVCECCTGYLHPYSYPCPTAVAAGVRLIEAT